MTAATAFAQVEHHYAQINGIRMHWVTAGDQRRTPVVLCHGWPDFWYGWRNQIRPLQEAGFYVIAPDLRGFGETDAPPNVADYAILTLVSDLAALLDHLNISRAVFIGHDWGGALVWRMALFHPLRVIAVAGLCTPFTPRTSTFFPLEDIVQRVPAFAYQLFLVSDGAAEQLDAQAERFFRLIMRSSAPSDRASTPFAIDNEGRLHLSDSSPSPMMSEEDLRCYVDTFRRRGFAGGLNWYKTRRINWEQEAGVAMRITHDALMITAGKDPVLSPKLAAKMEETVPNLTRGHIEPAAHWVHVEQAVAVNRILLTWLSSLGLPAPTPRM